MPVNLLPVETKKNSALMQVRHRVYLWTTITIVVYLIVVSGLAGWWLFLSNRQTTLSAEVTSLSTQVQGLAPVEAALRYQLARIESIESFLSSRRVYSRDLATLITHGPTVDVKNWHASLAGKNFVVVAASSSAEIETFAHKLQPEFSHIVLDQMTRKSDGSWEANVSFALSSSPARQ